MTEVLTVLTYKSAHRIASNGGTQSWVISPRRARRCDYVVCVRHQQGPYKAEGHEPHKHAFMVGRVSGVSPSSETPGRFRVDMSEYAIVDGPHIPLISASPTQYFPSLGSLGIDETALNWKSISDLPGDYLSISFLGGGEAAGDAAHDGRDGDGKDGKDGNDAFDCGGTAPMLVFLQAKKLVAAGLKIPLASVEIVIRA